jgi:RNA polymerase sigma-70 factor (ECF subfamily)
LRPAPACNQLPRGARKTYSGMDLLDRFARGDLEAFETLFRQFHREVHRWLVRLTRDPAAADDLTVEVFWRIYRAHARFDATRSFGAWARQIASNAAIDHLRHAGRERAASSVVPSARMPDSAARRDLNVRVERAFLTLPPKLRVVAELAFVENWPQEEISSALGISRSAVKARAFRAMKCLKDALKREGIE